MKPKYLNAGALSYILRHTDRYRLAVITWPYVVTPAPIHSTPSAPCRYFERNPE
jgi:hypothetical protein